MTRRRQRAGLDADRPAAVLGAGSWGTALALHLARTGPVRLWCRRADRARAITAERTNEAYLPGVRLPAAISVTDDLGRVVDGASLVVLAVPTQSLRAALERPGMARRPPDAPCILAGKGIEIGSGLLPSGIVAEALGEADGAAAVALSGPSFATELVAGQPTAVVAACERADTALAVQDRFSGANLRVYSSTDRLGVQLAGALKNVVAIGAGVSDGLGFGANARAALITRSLAEIARLGVAAGASRETFFGLAGVGDLVLTCTGDLSRNRRVGLGLGRGQALPDILDEMKMVAEGVETAKAAREMARRLGVEMPIVEQVHALLHEGKAPADALSDLLSRPLRAEPEEGGR